MSEHDAEQRVREWVDFDARNHPAYPDTGRLGISYEGYPLTRGDLREVLRQLDEARSELGRRIRQRDYAHKARINSEQERDEARAIARNVATALTTYGREVEGVAELEVLVVAWGATPTGEPLPDWLTADPQQQPHHGPHKGQGDDESTAATTNQRNTQNKPQNHATDHGGQP